MTSLPRPGALLVLIVIGAAACGPAASPQPSQTVVHVKISSLQPGNGPAVGAPCDRNSINGFIKDLPGTPIKVTDESGTIVGLVPVSAAGVVEASGDFPVCTFDTPVPVGPAKFYTLAVGRFGGTTISSPDLQKQGSVVVLAIKGS